MNIVKMWCTRNLKIRGELDGRAAPPRIGAQKVTTNRKKIELTLSLQIFSLAFIPLVCFRDEQFSNLSFGGMGSALTMSRVHCFQFPCIKGWSRGSGEGSHNKWMVSSLFCGRREPNVECNFTRLNISGDKVNFLLDTHTFAMHIRSHRNVFSSIFFWWSRIFNEIFHWVTNIKRWCRIMAFPALIIIIIIIICAHASNASLLTCATFFSVRSGFGVMQILPSNQSFECCEGKANRIY